MMFNISDFILDCSTFCVFPLSSAFHLNLVSLVSWLVWSVTMKHLTLIVFVIIGHVLDHVKIRKLAVCYELIEISG